MYAADLPSYSGENDDLSDDNYDEEVQSPSSSETNIHPRRSTLRMERLNLVNVESINIIERNTKEERCKIRKQACTAVCQMVKSIRKFVEDNVDEGDFPYVRVYPIEIPDRPYVIGEIHIRKVRRDEREFYASNKEWQTTDEPSENMHSDSVTMDPL
jgi:hypothetical protein